MNARGPVTIPPTQLRAGHRLRIGREATAVVRDVWSTDNWVYAEVDGLYFTLMIEPHSTVTIDHPHPEP